MPAIDHLVLAVPDLSAACALYRAMGFAVGSPNRHPWGTINAVVALDGSYLELIGLADDFRAPAPDDPVASFACPVAAGVARGGGLVALAIASEDADGDAARFRAAGLGAGRRLDFARTAIDPDGKTRLLRFGLAFANLPDLPEAGFFSCRHHQPFGAAPRHPNGVVRLGAAALAADAPGRHAPALAALVGPPARGSDPELEFETATGRLAVLTPGNASARYATRPAPGRFAAVELVTGQMSRLRAALAHAGVPHAAFAGAVVVPPTAAFGVALAFGPAACEAMG